MRVDAKPFDAVDWALRLGVALVFVGVGCEKVFSSRSSYWITIFNEIGFGLWFMYFTGAVQIVGGLLMIVPRTTLAGAALLACTMIGAMLAHMFLLPTGIGGAIIPAALLALILAAARGRDTDASDAEPLHLR